MFDFNSRAAYHQARIDFNQRLAELDALHPVDERPSHNMTEEDLSRIDAAKEKPQTAEEAAAAILKQFGEAGMRVIND